MSRRYAQAVRIPAAAPPTGSVLAVRAEVRHDGHAPTGFLWRGRPYAVRAVLSHWVEASPWWRTSAAHGSQGMDLPAERGDREVWRVEAAAGRSGVLGVYDLCRDTGTGEWSLVRSLD